MAPLILSAVYTRNRDATYYLSAGVATLGTIVMTTSACRKDAKVLGKQNIIDVRERSNSQNSNGKDAKSDMDVEMSPVQGVSESNVSKETDSTQPTSSQVSVEMNPAPTTTSSEPVIVSISQTAISA